MAWTSPRTWVASEVVTAALLNTHVRDNMNALADGSWGSDRTIVLKAADEGVLNSATVQSDDHLSFAVSASAKYLVEFKLIVSQDGNAVGADFKFGFSLPTGASWTGGDGLPDLTVGATAAGSGNWTAVLAGSGATRSCGVDGNAGNITGLSFTILIATAGTAGTVTLQWAQNTATGGVTTTVKANSWLRAERVV